MSKIYSTSTIETEIGRIILAFEYFDQHRRLTIITNDQNKGIYYHSLPDNEWGYESVTLQELIEYLKTNFSTDNLAEMLAELVYSCEDDD